MNVTVDWEVRDYRNELTPQTRQRFETRERGGEPYQDTVWSNLYSGAGSVVDTANAAMTDCRLLAQSITQIA